MANVDNNPPLLIITFSLVPVSKYACVSFVAPMRKSSNRSWINKNNNRIIDMKHLWNSRSPNGGDLEKCTGFVVNDCKYFDCPCNYETCFICAWKDTPVFKLRGLCPNTDIDRKYVLLPEKTFGGNVYFWGLRSNNILFNQETNSWQIVKNLTDDIFKPGGISTSSLDIVGTFHPDRSNTHYLPVGTHLWNMTEKNCNKVLQLKLTQVSTMITLI